MALSKPRNPGFGYTRSVTNLNILNYRKHKLFRLLKKIFFLSIGLTMVSILLGAQSLVIIVAIACAFAYGAQITRRAKRYSVSQGFREDHDNGMHLTNINQ